MVVTVKKNRFLVVINRQKKNIHIKRIILFLHLFFHNNKNVNYLSSHLFSFVNISLNFNYKPKTFDTYGTKITTNDVMFVVVNNNLNQSSIQFARYNYSLQCGIGFNDSRHCIYSIGIGERQKSSVVYVFVTGEIIFSTIIFIEPETCDFPQSNDAILYRNEFIIKSTRFTKY